MQQVKENYDGNARKFGRGCVVVGATMFPITLLLIIFDSLNMQFGWFPSSHLAGTWEWVIFWLNQVLLLVITISITWAMLPFLKEMWAKEK